MKEPVLQVKNLVKNFGSFKALKGISFEIPKGKVVGLLGPNGAGKTTTINILLGITLSSGGNIQYFGKDFEKNRLYCLQRINFTSAFSNLMGRISVWENFLVFANLYNVPNPEQKIKKLVAFFEIEYLINQRFWDISAGERTRANIIKSLINDPEVILMDEPTAALDPDIADKTLSLIENLRRDRGTSVLYTSHDMKEVTRVCDEVVFLDKGKIVAQDTPLGLTKRIKNVQLKLTFDGERKLIENHLKNQSVNYEFPHNYVVVINTEEKEVPRIIFETSKLRITVTDIDIRKPTLEDVFLQLARVKHVSK